MGTRFHNINDSFNCFFVTTTFNNWLPLLINEKYYKLIDDSISFVCNKYNADIIAFVWMPSHIHIIIFFNEENNLSELMRDFKKFTAAQIRRLLINDNRTELLEKLIYKSRTQQYKIWMDRFDSVIIKSKRVLFTKIEYIHKNPVRKQICDKSEDYENSSAAFYAGNEHTRLKIRHAGEII